MDARKCHDGVIVLNSGVERRPLSRSLAATPIAIALALCGTLDIGSCITYCSIVAATSIACTSESTVSVDADLASPIVS